MRPKIHLCGPPRHQQQHLHDVAERQGAVDRGGRRARVALMAGTGPGSDRRPRSPKLLKRVPGHPVQADQRLSGRVDRGRCLAMERGEGRRLVLVMDGRQGSASRTGSRRTRSRSSCRPPRSGSPELAGRAVPGRDRKPRRAARLFRPSMRAAARSGAPLIGPPGIAAEPRGRRCAAGLRRHGQGNPDFVADIQKLNVELDPLPGAAGGATGGADPRRTGRGARTRHPGVRPGNASRR